MTQERSKQSAGLESFWDYRESMKRRLKLGAPSSLADPLGRYEANLALTPLNERLIQAIWANHHPLDCRVVLTNFCSQKSYCRNLCSGS